MPDKPAPIDRNPPDDAPSAFDGYTVAEAAKLPLDELDARLEALVRECREAARNVH